MNILQNGKFLVASELSASLGSNCCRGDGSRSVSVTALVCSQ